MSRPRFRVIEGLGVHEENLPVETIATGQFAQLAESLGVISMNRALNVRVLQLLEGENTAFRSLVGEYVDPGYVGKVMDSVEDVPIAITSISYGRQVADGGITEGRNENGERKAFIEMRFLNSLIGRMATALECQDQADVEVARWTAVQTASAAARGLILSRRVIERVGQDQQPAMRFVIENSLGQIGTTEFQESDLGKLLEKYGTDSRQLPALHAAIQPYRVAARFAYDRLDQMLRSDKLWFEDEDVDGVINRLRYREEYGTVQQMLAGDTGVVCYPIDMGLVSPLSREDCKKLLSFGTCEDALLNP